MSSHHIVREKQEPALLVLSLSSFSREYLGQLLEWSPTVIVTPDSYDELTSEGIKVDWLLGQDNAVVSQNDIKIISSKNKNYLSDAIEELIIRGYPAVNIICDELPQRMIDHAARINFVIYHGDEKAFAVKSGYEKWLPANEKIKLNSPTTQVKTVNLKKLSDMVYQAEKDGMIRVEFDQPYLVVSEFL